MNDRETCDRCGAIRDSSDLGRVNDLRFCHGFIDASPTCYEIASTFNHGVISEHGRAAMAFVAEHEAQRAAVDPLKDPKD